MNNKFKILVVKPRSRKSAITKSFLEDQGFQVVIAHTYAESNLIFQSTHTDLVIIDLALADKLGYQLIKDMRKSSIVPILAIVSSDTQDSMLEALEAGANDFIRVPIHLEELLVRIRKMLREHHLAEQIITSKGYFKNNGLMINFDERLVYVDGAEVKLTQTEYNIIALLAEHYGHVMTYSEIIKRIWNWSDEGSIKRLQVNMANIRKKLNHSSDKRQYIANELGIGYRIARDESEMEVKK